MYQKRSPESQTRSEFGSDLPLLVKREFEPPDGGLRAWMVVVSAFLCEGVIFGVINSYSVIHSELLEKLVLQNETDASSKAALVGSITFGTTLFTSPLAGMFSDHFGLPLTTTTGGAICIVGMYISSFFADHVRVLYFTYGVMFGFGAALVYTPTLAILGHYFQRHLGKVNGFVTTGASVFTIGLPPLLSLMIDSTGLVGALRLIAGLSAILVAAAIFYKPLKPPSCVARRNCEDCMWRHILTNVVNMRILRQRRYIVWTLCCALALLGYYVPYVHMVKIVQTMFPGENENLPIMCIGATSALGRLLCGFLSDSSGIKRVYLHQIALAGIGLLTALLPLTGSYILFIACTLLMGFFDGFFISVLGPIVNEFCGVDGAAQGIGFFFGSVAIPVTVGPPIAGWIFDQTGSYMVPLILAGMPAIAGAGLLLFVEFYNFEPSRSREPC